MIMKSNNKPHMSMKRMPSVYRNEEVDNENEH